MEINAYLHLSYMLSIPNPCNEDFTKMTPTERGAFCNKCAIDTYDFRKLSNLEIKEILLAKSNEPKCGQFYPKQIEEFNRNAQISARKRKWKYFTTAASITLLLGSCADVANKTRLAKTSQKPIATLYVDERILMHSKPHQYLIERKENYTFLPPPPAVEDIEDEEIYYEVEPIYASENVGKSTEVNAVIITYDRIKVRDIEHTAGVPMLDFYEQPVDGKTVEKQGFFKRLFSRKK